MPYTLLDGVQFMTPIDQPLSAPDLATPQYLCAIVASLNHCKDVRAGMSSTKYEWLGTADTETWNPGGGQS